MVKEASFEEVFRYISESKDKKIQKDLALWHTEPDYRIDLESLYSKSQNPKKLRDEIDKVPVKGQNSKITFRHLLGDDINALPIVHVRECSTPNCGQREAGCWFVHSKQVDPAYLKYLNAQKATEAAASTSSISSTATTVPLAPSSNSSAAITNTPTISTTTHVPASNTLASSSSSTGSSSSKSKKSSTSSSAVVSVAAATPALDVPRTGLAPPPPPSSSSTTTEKRHSSSSSPKSEKKRSSSSKVNRHRSRSRSSDRHHHHSSSSKSKSSSFSTTFGQKTTNSSSTLSSAPSVALLRKSFDQIIPKEDPLYPTSSKHSPLHRPSPQPLNLNDPAISNFIEKMVDEKFRQLNENRISQMEMQLTELQTSIEKLQDFNTKSMKPLQAELKEIKAKTSRNIDHFRRLAENQKVYKFSIEAHQADIQELQEHLSHFEASIHQFDADSGKLASLETELKGLLNSLDNYKAAKAVGVAYTSPDIATNGSWVKNTSPELQQGINFLRNAGGGGGAVPQNGTAAVVGDLRRKELVELALGIHEDKRFRTDDQ